MTLRQFDIPASQWQSQDTAALRKTLAEITADPALARAWRGSIVLNFAEVEEIEESHPYLNPKIAGCLHDLYSQFPYLLYFLDPDRPSGALDGFFASIGALCQTDEGIWVLWSDEVGTAYYRALAAAAEFAAKCGDDWVAVVRGYEERAFLFDEIREALINRGAILA
jgi:hypothetical protein